MQNTIPTPTTGLYSVYQYGDRWLVQESETRGFGDSLYDSREEAEAESARIIKLNAANEAFRARQRAEEDALNAKQTERYLPLVTYLKSLTISTMQKGKLRVAMSVAVSKTTGGKTYSGTRFEVTQALIDNGFNPATEDVRAVKDLTGRQYNRMDNRQQDSFEKRQAQAGNKTEYRLQTEDGRFFVVTKAEHDYAFYLITPAN